MPTFDVLAFDADDTLWHTEYLYADAQNQFKQLMAQYLEPAEIEERLYQTEIRNLKHFGYGIKGFALSMIETAVELSDGAITGKEVQTLLDLAKTMITSDVRLLDGVLETLAELAATYRLMLITKGDLYDQEAKIARSGVGNFFKDIEIISSKPPEAYQVLLTKYRLAPENFLMVGNSLRSDILPVLEIGGHAVYIPYEVTWAHEVADAPADNHAGFFQLANMRQLPELIARLTK